jgi:hypothetical protein
MLPNFREMVAHEIGGQLAQQHLPAVACVEQARDAVEVRADVIVAALLGHASVQGHAHLEHADWAPRLRMQGALRSQRGSQRD